MALLSAATLAYEVLLVRVFAIEQFHHFAYMAVGVAMLGFGAAGTLVAVAGRIPRSHGLALVRHERDRCRVRLDRKPGPHAHHFGGFHSDRLGRRPVDPSWLDLRPSGFALRAGCTRHPSGAWAGGGPAGAHLWSELPRVGHGCRRGDGRPGLALAGARYGSAGRNRGARRPGGSQARGVGVERVALGGRGGCGQRAVPPFVASGDYSVQGPPAGGGFPRVAADRRAPLPPRLGRRGRGSGVPRRTWAFPRLQRRASTPNGDLRGRAARGCADRLVLSGGGPGRARLAAVGPSLCPGTTRARARARSRGRHGGMERGLARRPERRGGRTAPRRGRARVDSGAHP